VVSTPRPSQSQRNARVDSLKWESALAFVRAASELKTKIKEFGLMSEEAKQAQHHADETLKRYKKLRLM
jgi:hypothetical protein